MSERSANPYPGLRSFEVEEDYLFFGREGQSEEILARLRHNRLGAVVGTSGSGKSSLIRAGLLPYLFGGFMTGAGSHWRVAVMRPGGDPIRNLAAKLNDPLVLGDPDASGEDAQQNATLIEVTLRRSGLGLIEAVRQAHLPEVDNVLIVVDQFEELFRFAEPASSLRKEDDAAAFVKLLLESVRSDELPIYVVMTMRSDFIGDCARYRDLPEAVTGGLYLIPRMTRDQRREAIEHPARVAGSEISRRLMNRLLNDCGDNPDQLPILQHALMRTWEYWSQHRSPEEPIDLADYKEIGEMAEALSLHAEEAYGELPSDRFRDIAKRLFQALTEKGGDNREIRTPTAVSIVAAIADATVSEVIEVIEYFRRPGRSFLTPAADVPLTGDLMIDISHESLIRGWKRLDVWVNEEKESVDVYRRLAETAALHEQGRAGLWSDPDLTFALKWRVRANPNTVWATSYHPGFNAAMDFLDQSATARFRRKLTTGVIAGVVAVCLSVLGIGWIHDSVKRAREEANQARAEASRQVEETQARAEQDKEALKHAEELKDAEEKSLQSQQETEWVRDAARTGDQMRAENASALESVSSMLRTEAPPDQKVEMEILRANALTTTGRHEEAVRAYTAALRLHPDQKNIQAERGYEYILLGRPEDARTDFEAYLQTDPNNFLDRANLAIALAMLKDYREAIAQMELSIKDFKFGSQGMFDSEVSPDIQRATGQKLISTTPVNFYVASHYEVATLLAFAGDPGFEKALERADRVARQQGFYVPESGGEVNASNGSVDPFVLAIEWAWLDARAATGRLDYGVYAAYGALWARAGRVQPRFKDWAGHFFITFQRIHAKQKDRRYEDLASWIDGQLRKLYPGGMKQDILAQAPATPGTLQTQAALLELQEDYTGAAAAVSDAIREVDRDPNGRGQLVSLLLQRAIIDEHLKDTKKAREDYQRIIQLQPQTAYAHYYLGDTDPAKDPVVQQREYELAMKYDPQFALAKNSLAILIWKKDPKRAIELLQEANKVGVPNAVIYESLAYIQNSIGDYANALTSINAAIALSPDKLGYYDIKDEAERGLGRDPVERALDMASAYRSEADRLSRSGATDDALSTYLQALRKLASDTAGKEDDSVRAEETVEAHDISQMLERISSRKDAKQFWASVSSTPYLEPASKIVQQEIQRLSNP